jgi:anti-sigma factor RsiW
MDCRLVRRHLSAYVDSELEPTAVLELEAHLTHCAGCALQWRFLSALKFEVRKQHLAVSAPAHLRARVASALVAMPVQSLGEQSNSQVWWTILSIAASVLLVTGALVGTDRGSPGKYASAEANPLDIVREVVDRHKERLPVEISTQIPEKATNWFRDKVGFRVRTVEFSQPDVQFEGARISQVGSNQAAKLLYRVGDSQITLVMFKAPPALQRMLGSQTELEPAKRVRLSSGREVPYSTREGYTVPVVQDDGIVYAFTGDLDQRVLLQLVATARFPH